jgi:AsmA-like protein
VAAGVLVFIFLTAAARIPFSSDTLRKRLVGTLSDRLDADVELGDLKLRALPTLHAEGTGLTVRLRGRTDVPPLISIKTFTADANLVNVWRKHVSRVKLDGLVIQIPPDKTPDSTEPDSNTGEHVVKGRQVVIDELTADGSELVIIPKNREKDPKVWQMHTLRVNNVGANTKMPFDAQLRNAVPPGEIDTEGHFGPWHRDDPGHTPVDGRFTFEKADLGVFKGISGTLAAKGTYQGSLDTIEVNGETDTPDFTLDIAGHGVPLHTKYHAVVDGTNGDTRLEQIDASFLNTSFTAKGGVFDVKGVKGRQVILDVAMDKARLEDIMRLAVKSTKAPMTGALKLKTKFVLPPGEPDVVDRLRLDGSFSIDSGGFTDAGVQSKINDMSRRASGNVGDAAVQPAAPKVGSDFQGRFILADGVLQMPSLVFDIPGAAVKLNGTYALERETIAFSGNLYMDAKVSQTVTGWKSMLLKIADPLFSENGKTVVPIKITGTRDNPQFGIDRARVFK